MVVHSVHERRNDLTGIQTRAKKVARKQAKKRPPPQSPSPRGPDWVGYFEEQAAPVVCGSGATPTKSAQQAAVKGGANSLAQFTAQPAYHLAGIAAPAIGLQSSRSSAMAQISDVATCRR